jgi:nitroreductase
MPADFPYRTRRTIKPNLMDSNLEIDRALLLEILEDANWAPTHGLTQPWRFHLFLGDARHALADALESIYDQITPPDEIRPQTPRQLRASPGDNRRRHPHRSKRQNHTPRRNMRHCLRRPEYPPLRTSTRPRLILVLRPRRMLSRIPDLAGPRFHPSTPRPPLPRIPKTRPHPHFNPFPSNRLHNFPRSNRITNSPSLTPPEVATDFIKHRHTFKRNGCAPHLPFQLTRHHLILYYQPRYQRSDRSVVRRGSKHFFHLFQLSPAPAFRDEWVLPTLVSTRTRTRSGSQRRWPSTPGY